MQIESELVSLIASRAGSGRSEGRITGDVCGCPNPPVIFERETFKRANSKNRHQSSSLPILPLILASGSPWGLWLRLACQDRKF
ncbi:unnamed protein product [Phyllotreta striolata]|uniref:Uncharacterized protein n=1 Tax=Phyllotreta striolata TaxID=444603 RepID=A0A9N9TPH0_PHYSR|nr:unnamed protein product [Phyllotreta striolata]